MPSGGSDYLLAMVDQSRRARAFDRRLRWSRMRHQLATEEVSSSGVPAVPRQRC